MSSRTLVFNTSATSIRSIIAAGLGLFSSRWILEALGPSDYGIFGLVGSVIIFITFLNSVMATSASRHFAFSIGRNDFQEVQKWFNASLSIHLILPIVLIVIGWPIGEYCILHIFTIPYERIPTCLWVFRLSLLSAFFSMVCIPYVAMFTAKQRIAELAAWGVLNSVLLFGFAYILSSIHGNRLLYYAAYYVIISVLIQISQMIRAHHIFYECRINLKQWFDKRRFIEIFSFASWNLIGHCGNIFRDQGSAVLLNLRFGPIINASFGIANQLAAQTNQLAIALLGAFSPEIISCEGRGDRSGMLLLAHRVCKYGTILTLFFTIPMIIEMDYILHLWLGDPPEYTAYLCQFLLVALLLDRLSGGYMLALIAGGRIAGYQATLGTLLILTPLLGWLIFNLGAPPFGIGIAYIFMMGMVSAGRILWAHRIFNISIVIWIIEILIPSCIVFILVSCLTIIPRLLLFPSLQRLLFTTFICFVVTTIASWYIILDIEEKCHIKKIIFKDAR